MLNPWWVGQSGNCWTPRHSWLPFSRMASEKGVICTLALENLLTLLEYLTLGKSYRGDRGDLILDLHTHVACV